MSASARLERTEKARSALDVLRAPIVAQAERVLAREEAADGIGVVVARAYAASLDRWIGELFQDTLRALGGGAGIALAAVGGYGRGMLALGADLDVRIVTREVEAAGAIADAFLYPLWDAGLAIGHQVATIDDLLAAAASDLPTMTSLLDWRFIAGDSELSEELVARAKVELFGMSALPELLARLDAEVTGRHRRFGASVYLLEPDVRNGQGGLRDLDVVRWAMRARFGVGDFDGLVGVGVLVGRQLEAVLSARERIWRIRNLLHARAGRRQDRLSFEEQEAIAAPLGYLEPDHHEGEAKVASAVERMMSDYYRAARTVSRLRELVIDAVDSDVARSRHSPSTIVEDGICVRAGVLMLDEPARLETDPALALRLVHEAVFRGVPLAGSTRAAIVQGAGDDAWAARLRASAEAGRLFVELVCNCRPTQLRRLTTMREIHDLGLLLAMVPEFAPLVGRVHHDTYHVYTVDVHSVAAVDRLGEIVRGDIVLDDDEQCRFAGTLACNVGSDLAQPKVLFFATLLHDIGKAIGRSDHSERGGELARQILLRLPFDPREIDEVVHLIRHHLTMYHVATRRDLEDPETVDEFAHVVGNRECVRNLYLLTVADLSTTSPTSMTSWKARLLDELFLATDELLRGSSREAAAGGALALRRAEARALARAAVATASSDDDGERLAVLERFLAAMPSRYQLANPPAAMVDHAELVHLHLKSGRRVSLGLVRSHLGQADELCVVADDARGLLADITAAIARAKLEVLSAEVQSCGIALADGSSPRALAVDIFWVQHLFDGSAGVEEALARVEADLCALIAGQIGARELVPRRTAGRALLEPSVSTRVRVDNRASSRYSVVEVVTRDRFGLLFELSHALHHLGLSISLAKIATEGTRVVDVFYVSEPDGRKLHEKRARQIEGTLSDLLAGMDGQPSAR